MPTVMQFDDPRLLLTLASQAGQYAHDQQSQNQANQLLAVAQQGLAQRQQAASQQQQYAQMAAGQGQQQQAAPNFPDWTERVPVPGGLEDDSGGGALIFHPPGESMPGPGAVNGQGQPLFGAPKQQGGVLPGGGYMNPTQQAYGKLADDMAAKGQLTAEEQARYKGIILGGGNPFTNPTEAERLRQYSTEQQPGQDQRNQTQADQQARFDYEREKSSIEDRLKTLRDQLKNEYAPDKKNALQAQIDQQQRALDATTTKDYHTPALQRLQKSRPNAIQQVGQTLINGSTGTAGAAPVGPATGAPTSAPPPLTPVDMDFLHSLYGSDIGKAKAAAAAGVRAPAGWRPSQQSPPSQPDTTPQYPDGGGPIMNA